MKYRPVKRRGASKTETPFNDDAEGVVAGIVNIGGKLDGEPVVFATPWGKQWIVHVKEPLVGTEAAENFYKNNPDVMVFCNGIECSILDNKEKIRVS